MCCLLFVGKGAGLQIVCGESLTLEYFGAPEEVVVVVVAAASVTTWVAISRRIGLCWLAYRRLFFRQLSGRFVIIAAEFIFISWLSSDGGLGQNVASQSRASTSKFEVEVQIHKPKSKSCCTLTSPKAFLRSERDKLGELRLMIGCIGSLIPTLLQRPHLAPLLQLNPVATFFVRVTRDWERLTT